MTDDRPTSVRKRSVALITTLLLLVLLVAIVAQMVTATSVDSIQAVRQANSLQHRLAVDGMLLLLAAKLASDDYLPIELDRSGRAVIETKLGRCNIHCEVTDDGAKLDVTAFGRPTQRRLLTRKITALTRAFDLPNARIKLRPVRIDSKQKQEQRTYYWFDQLFHDPPPGIFFRPDTVDPQSEVSTSIAWSDVVTLFGSGRIDVRRASRQILDIALADLDRGLGRTILSARKQSKSEHNFLPEALSRLSDAIRSKVAARLGFDLHRYALDIQTSIGGDRRRWYVVATIGADSVDIHYRGQIRW